MSGLSECSDSEANACQSERSDSAANAGQSEHSDSAASAGRESDEQQLLPYRAAEQLQFWRHILLELCWYHYESYLVTSSGGDRRKVASRLRTAKEYQHTQYAEEVLPITCSRLPQQAAETLQRQFEKLRNRMQRDLRNDARWILSTGSQYGPTRQHILQVLCRLVYKWLLATFEDPALARTLARIFYDLGKGLWYHQTLHYFLPILADEDVAPLQQWYADYCDQQRLQHRILYGLQGEQADDTTATAEGPEAPREVCEDFSPDAGPWAMPAHLALPFSAEQTTTSILAAQEPSSSSSRR